MASSTSSSHFTSTYQPAPYYRLNAGPPEATSPVPGHGPSRFEYSPDLSSSSTAATLSPDSSRSRSSSSDVDIGSPYTVHHGHFAGPSMLDTLSEHRNAVTHHPNRIRSAEKQQRLWLNRLVLLLPGPLKPLARSVTRLIVSVAVLLFALLLFTYCFSDSYEIPPMRIPSPPYPFSAAGTTATLASSIATPAPTSIPHQSNHDLSKRDQVILDGLQPLAATIDVGTSLSANETQVDPAVLAYNESVVVNLTRQVDTCNDNLERMRNAEPICGSRGCDPEGYLKGYETLTSHIPKGHFRENLRKDLNYLTFGLTNGFSNQFLAHLNGLYLAKLTDRVPVLPPFVAFAHMDRRASGYLAFSQVFDVPRLETLLRHPIQEWKNLKVAAEQAAPMSGPPNPEFKDDKLRGRVAASVKKDDVACWSLWQIQMPNPGKPAGSGVQNHLGLNIDYWPAPSNFADPPHDRHILFWDLVLLDKDIENIRKDQIAKVAQIKREETKGKQERDGDTSDTVKKGVLLTPPDDQMICYDTLYYAAATGPREWWQPHAPVWTSIGRYARWHADVDQAADDYLRRLFELKKGVHVPEFVTVHIRRGDFAKSCGTTGSKDCLATIATYKQAVHRVRAQVLDDAGTYARAVVVTTDEKDPVYLESLRKVGWKVVDHAKLKTARTYGNPWWEIVIDAAILSRGKAFVGTDRSMMSLLSGKRVEAWNKGPWELVKWGSKTAGK